jgi:putative phosphoribosyl transferase
VIFTDRVEAGRRLALALTHLRGHDVVVLGLPRGGVPVAYEVGRALDAPLDVIVVRKIGVPWQPELAMGAVGEDGATIVNTTVIRAARVDLTGRTAIVVDDGLATGATARVACQVAREQGAARVVLAVPVGSPHAVATMSDVADEVVCVEQPAGFQAVGQYYEDFSETTDGDVVALLDEASAAYDRGGSPTGRLLHREPRRSA